MEKPRTRKHEFLKRTVSYKTEFDTQLHIESCSATNSNRDEISILHKFVSYTSTE